jgi:hypothetical protein
VKSGKVAREDRGKKNTASGARTSRAPFESCGWTRVRQGGWRFNRTLVGEGTADRSCARYALRQRKDGQR